MTRRAQASGRRARPAASVRLLVCALGVPGLVAGCARTRVAEPLATVAPAGDAEAAAAFWHGLPSRGAVTNDEVLHALFLLADGADPARGYAERVDRARRRGWVETRFHAPGDEVAERGLVALAVSRICRVEGGVMMRLVGGRRYALLEVTRLGIMPPGTEWQAVSGGELVGIAGRVQDYLLIRGIDASEPASEIDAGAGGSGEGDAATTVDGGPAERNAPSVPDGAPVEPDAPVGGREP